MLASNYKSRRNTHWLTSYTIWSALKLTDQKNRSSRSQINRVIYSIDWTNGDAILRQPFIYQGAARTARFQTNLIANWFHLFVMLNRMEEKTHENQLVQGLRFEWNVKVNWISPLHQLTPSTFQCRFGVNWKSIECNQSSIKK